MPKIDNHDIKRASLKIDQLTAMITLAENSSKLNILGQWIPLNNIAVVHLSSKVHCLHFDQIMFLQLSDQFPCSVLEILFVF